MELHEAIVARINQICQEKNLSICDISLKAGMSPSNIYALIKMRTKNSKINTIQKFCEGAQITLAQFFTSPLFNDIQSED